MGCWLSGQGPARGVLTLAERPSSIFHTIKDLGYKLGWNDVEPERSELTREELADIFYNCKCKILCSGIRELLVEFTAHNVRFVGTSGNIQIAKNGRTVTSFGEPKGGMNTWGENFVYTSPLPKGDHGVFEMTVSIKKENIHTPDMGIGVIRKRVLDREKTLERGNIIRLGKFFCLYPSSNHQVLTAANYGSQLINRMPKKCTITLRLDYDANSIQFIWNNRPIARALKKKFNLRLHKDDNREEFLFACAFKNAGDTLEIS